MSQHAVHERGGIPVIQRVTVAVSPAFSPIMVQDDELQKRGRTMWITIQNVGANPARIFFTEEAATANVNFWTLAVNGVLEGPWEARSNPLPAGSSQITNNNPGHIWVAGVGGATDIEVIFTIRS